MDLGLRGRTAVITGSSEGIGFAIARALAEEGCNVVLSGRRDDRLSAALREIEQAGVRVTGVVVDLSTEDGCRKLIERTIAEFGGLDILVNNVGGMIPGKLETLSKEQWDQVIDVNLMAAVYTTKHAVPHLKRSSMGRILNISGVTGRQLLPGALTTTLPNAAIIGFTKVMAGELGAHNVTVNNLCPGFTNTSSWGPRAQAMAKVRGVTAADVRTGIAQQTLLGRWAEPEEIGSVAAFLVSSKNSYMTGTTVEVCGGFTRYI